MNNLGYKMRDEVTGFVGVAMGYVQYLTGCNQFMLVPPVDKDGKRIDGEWFDEERCKVVSRKPIALSGGQTTAVSKGGDLAPPKR